MNKHNWNKQGKWQAWLSLPQTQERLEEISRQVQAQSRRVIQEASKPDGHPHTEACILKGMEMVLAWLKSTQEREVAGE